MEKYRSLVAVTVIPKGIYDEIDDLYGESFSAQSWIFLSWAFSPVSTDDDEQAPPGEDGEGYMLGGKPTTDHNRSIVDGDKDDDDDLLL